MEKIKVFLSDPQILFREGIHFILSGEDDFEVIGETTSNDEAFTLIENNAPHIGILSMKNGKLTGPEATRRIKRNLSSVHVILITDKTDDEQLFATMKCGASACLTKDTEPEYLLDIIRVVAQGSQPIIEFMLTPELASRVLTEFEDLATLNQQLDNLLAHLSPKETAILKSIAAGNSLEQAAASLNTNEENVRRNLRLILNKLTANDQARSVIEAAQRSLPSIFSGAAQMGNASANYVTRDEFNEFKDSLMQRLKSFIGELT